MKLYRAVLILSDLCQTSEVHAGIFQERQTANEHVDAIAQVVRDAFEGEVEAIVLEDIVDFGVDVEDVLQRFEGLFNRKDED